MEFTIEAFVDKLLKEKGVTGLDAEVMTQLKSDLTERAEDLINAEIIAHMPKTALKDFEKILDDDSDEEIQKFCQKHIKNLDEVIAGALVKLQKIYLTGSAA